MSDTVIRVKNLGKRYELGRKQERYRTLRDSLADAVRAPFRKKQPAPEVWALKDVSFEIKRGEVVGVIGRNGAGKSTLLKILSRITEPTTGEIELTGRVGSLLEVGTGFHPELTGRENIFLNGAILGMRKTEIERKFDEIVAFAEIEKFLDTPVKQYSSGMYMRLAFAVAAHLEPEILLVDEVLAVGDIQFQKKCLGKMGEVARAGRTVLLVSHNMQAVTTLTKESILLHDGGLICQGPTNQVIAEHVRRVTSSNLVYVGEPSPTAPRITRVEVRTSETNNIQRNDAPMEVMFEITTPRAIRGAALSFQACNYMHLPVLHLWTFDSERAMCREPGIYRQICKIPRCRLYMGDYTLTAYLAERAGGEVFQTLEGICPFEVVMYGRPREYEWVAGTCTYIEDCEWDVSRI